MEKQSVLTRNISVGNYANQEEKLKNKVWKKWEDVTPNALSGMRIPVYERQNENTCIIWINQKYMNIFNNMMEFLTKKQCLIVRDGNQCKYHLSIEETL